MPVFARMLSTRLQMMGVGLGVIGWIMAIVVCALPMWKVTTYIRSEHGDRADLLGRDLDELCGAEHWADSVQAHNLEEPRAVTKVRLRPSTRASKRMVSQGIQIMGIVMGFLGWLGAIVTCGLPQWRVTAFIGSNIVTAQIIWEGIWMTCAVQSTGQMQCKVYDSMLALSADLQAARAMIVVSILAGVCGVMLSVAGGKCTNCIEDARSKAVACITAGVLFIIAGLLCLVPVSWSAHAIIADFYNPTVVDAQRRELGTSLYIGWASAGLFLLGGGLLCMSCPPKQQHIYNPKFTTVRSSLTSREYV